MIGTPLRVIFECAKCHGHGSYDREQPIRVTCSKSIYDKELLCMKCAEEEEARVKAFEERKANHQKGGTR